ncbi:uncharacterized protein LOC110714535 [Chenopodium quinoa]|uniref:uncharacterized protein LOC110714535 n=1 Tax=Chenopodium quinoa TaxID=63459 RepID=UPI000B76F166|nr:uncharacterized protein LOC110714535 [Chenopodium quinoa]
MSKISCFATISLLWLFSLTTSASASRRLTGVVVNQELPQNTTFQDPMKKMEKVKVKSTINMNEPSQVTSTKLLDDEDGMKTMKKERKKKEDRHDHKTEHDTKQSRRQDGATRAYTKTLTKLVKRKSPRVVLWRVPRPKNEVPQTGFNLDYAPPKVHPPTHN